jgi:hypothetical protein
MDHAHRRAGLGLIVAQWETVFHSDFAPTARRWQLLHNACAARPLHVNSHTGKDYYTHEQNPRTAATGRRYLAPARRADRARDPPQPLQRPPDAAAALPAAMPDLQLTADLSHWCCACESLLEDQPETLAATLPQVRHIHARVGHAQGPQVADFRAPESQAALAAHLAGGMKSSACAAPPVPAA